MKRIKIISSLLLAVMLFSAAFMGFNKNKSAIDAHAQNDPIRVGVSLPSLNNDHMAKIGAALQSAFSNRNMTINMQDALNDAARQVNHIDTFINQGINAIVVMPVDEHALINSLANAVQSGIVVIVIGPNNGLYPGARYINFDYDGLIEKVTDDFLNNHWDQSADTSVLVIACDNDHGRNYLAKIRDKYQPLGIDVEVIWVNGPADANMQMEAWLAANGGQLPDAIFNCCGANTQAVIDAMIAAGITFGPGGIPVYGSESGCTSHFDNMGETIANLIQDMLDGAVASPTGDEEPYLVDICTCTCCDDLAATCNGCGNG